jgi:single-strand DNA-binding protein
MVNKVILVGRLTADPDARTAATGRPVAYIRLATNTYLGKEPDGTRKEAVEYFSVVAFNHNAEYAANQLRKGSLVYVEGRSQTRTWEGEGGQSRQRTEVLVDQVHALQPRPSAPAPAGSEAPASDPEPMGRLQP